MKIIKITFQKKKYEEISDSVTFHFADDWEMTNTALELRRIYYNLKPEIRAGRHMKVEVKESTSTIYKKENLTEKEQKLLLGNQTPTLTGTLLKYTGWGAGSHPRIVSIYPTLLVHWRENERSKVHIGKIMSATAGNSRSLLKKKLTDEEASKLFTIHTTNKTLQLCAADSSERGRWLKTIQDLLFHEESERQKGLEVTDDNLPDVAIGTRHGRARTLSMIQRPGSYNSKTLPLPGKGHKKTVSSILSPSFFLRKKEPKFTSSNSSPDVLADSLTGNNMDSSGRMDVSGRMDTSSRMAATPRGNQVKPFGTKEDDDWS